MTPNDHKLSDGGPEAGAVSTAAQGEGAGCAGASWQAAQPVTEPVGPKPPPLLGTDMTAVRCSAWLGVAVEFTRDVGRSCLSEPRFKLADCLRGARLQRTN